MNVGAGGGSGLPGGGHNIGTGQGQVDPGLAAGAGIGPAAAGFTGTTNVGEGDARSLDLPVAPPITGGEGLGPTGPTPAEIEAMRIKLLLLQQEADKTAADEKVATIKQQEEEDAFLDSLKREYDFEDLEYGDDRGLMYMAHGGRVPAAYGGLMGNDGRRAYGLGSFFKSVTKPFKKAAKTIKKVAKSPIGKLALGYLATAGLGNLAAGGGNWSRFIGTAKKPGWLRPSQVWSNVAGMFPGSNTSSISNKETLQEAYDFHIKNKNWDTAEKIKKLIDSQGATGGLGQTAMKAASFGLPLLALKYPNLGEVPGLSMEDATAANQAAADAWAQTHLQGLDEEDWKLTPASGLTPLQYSAQGGRIGYDNGGDVMMASYDYNDAMAESFEAYQKAIKDGIIPPTMEFDEYLELMQGRKETAPQGIQMAAQGGRIGYDNGGSASDKYEAKIKELMDKGLSRELAEALVLSELSPDAYRILEKDGGRIGYAEGGDDEEDHRSAALSAMYGLRKNAQEGGLMDLGGMEKDYREGWFCTNRS